MPRGTRAHREVAVVSALDRIAVKVVSPAELPTGNAQALLNELAGLLDAWVSRGEAACIDLRSLPLSADVRETQYPGVWWVTHRNELKETVAELIEVCEVPAILRAPVEDAAAGLERLQATRRS
jgi:hydrogenase-1 operon protein HyaF